MIPFQVAAKKSPLVLRELQQRRGESLARCGDEKAALDALLAAAATYGRISGETADCDEPLHGSGIQPKHAFPDGKIALPFSSLGSAHSRNSCQPPETHHADTDLMLEDSYVLHLADSQGLAKDIVEAARSPKLFSWVPRVFRTRPRCLYEDAMSVAGFQVVR